jgi:hypothetical protein
MFGQKRDEIIECLKKNPRNEELHNLHSSPYINRMTRSRRMRWGGHVTRRGEE